MPAQVLAGGDQLAEEIGVGGGVHEHQQLTRCLLHRWQREDLLCRPLSSIASDTGADRGDCLAGQPRGPWSNVAMTG